MSTNSRRRGVCQRWLLVLVPQGARQPLRLLLTGDDVNRWFVVTKPLTNQQERREHGEQRHGRRQRETLVFVWKETSHIIFPSCVLTLFRPLCYSNPIVRWQLPPTNEFLPSLPHMSFWQQPDCRDANDTTRCCTKRRNKPKRSLFLFRKS